MKRLSLLVLLPLVSTLAACSCGEDVTVNETAPSIISSAPTAAVVGEEYSYTIAVDGNPNPEVTVSADDGDDLPDWLAFDSAGRRIHGTPSASDVGELQVEIVASNGVEPDARQSFVITVSGPPEAPLFTSTPATEATVGQPYSYAVTATGSPAPGISASRGDGAPLPAWITFDPTENVLSGTPSEDDLGELSVLLTAANGVQPHAVQSFLILVDLAHVAPAFTSSPATEVVAGEAYEYVATASGYPEPTFTAAGAGGEPLPAWLSFDETTATLSGSPGAGDVGSHAVVLSALNGAGEDLQDFVITVLPAPTAPAITSAPVTEAVVGQAYGYQVTATGHPAPVFSASVGANPLPTWLSIDSATGLFQGTPGTADIGSLGLVITADNGVSPVAIQTFVLNIILAPEAPAITSSPSLGVTAGEVYSYTVIATGNPSPTLSAAGAGGGALPGWLSFTPSTGLLQGTPQAAHVGEHDVVVRAINGVSPDAEQSFTITVSPAPRAPTITSTPVTQAMEGEVYSYQITADGEPEPTIQVTLQGGGSLPGWLAFDQQTALFMGTPGLADTGSLEIVVTASNGVLPNATQSFTVLVEAAPRAPQITSTPTLSAPAGSSWSYTIVATGHPEPTLHLSGLADWMSFDGTGTIHGTPSAFDVGAVADIEIEAENGVDPAALQSFTVTVVPAPSLPVATDPLNESFGWSLPEGWAANGDWQFGIPSVGPLALFDGPLAATVLDGNYSSLTLSSLLTPVLDLTGVPTPVMRFVHWHNIETGHFDGANMKISTDGGASFSELLPGTISPAYTGTILTGYDNPLAGETAWAGTTADWTIVTVDLAANLASEPLTEVVLRFDLGSDTMVERPGWYVDSVFVGDAADIPYPPSQIVTYRFDGDVKTPSFIAEDISAGIFDDRNGTAVFATGNGGGRAIVSLGWDDPNNPNFFHFTVTPDPGRQVTLSHLSFDERAPNNGPSDYEVHVLQDGNEYPVGGGTTLKQDFPQPSPMVTEAFSGAAAGPFEEPITIRISAGGATSSTSTWRLDNVVLAGWVELADAEAPVITSPPPPSTAAIGVGYSHTITATGSPIPVITVTDLPAWISFDGVDTIFGTPSAIDVGSSGTITIRAANGVNPDAVEEFEVNIDPPPSVPVVDGSPLEEGFGPALPIGWSASGDWEFGLPSHGPPELHDGELAATRLHSDYSADTRSILQSPPLDLAGAQEPLLRFHHWYQIENGGWDGGNVKISTDGGLSFRELVHGTASHGYTGTLRTSIPLSGESGWYGTIPNGVWTEVIVDLETNLGAHPRDQVVIRFDFAADPSIFAPGWYLDDVRVGALADIPVVPEIVSSPRRSVLAGDIYIYAVEATGFPAPALSASGPGGAALPSWLSFDEGTGELIGLPSAAHMGMHEIEITAANVGGSFVQAFELTVLAADTEPVFHDDFEGDPAGTEWTIGFDFGTGSDWEIGEPTAGPGVAFSGTRCAGTILNGSHTSSENRLSFMQTPVLDLTGVPDLYLLFHHWHDTSASANFGYDGGNVKISTDGGVSFAPLLPGTMTPAYPGTISTLYLNPLAGQPAWFGTTSAWTRVEVDLEANLESLPLDQVVIRFEFGAESYTKTRAGWYFDEVHVGSLAALP